MAFTILRTNTSAEAPTGNYTAKVVIGNRSLCKPKIETVAACSINQPLVPAKDSCKKLRQMAAMAVARNLHTTINGKAWIKPKLRSEYTGISVFDSPIRSYYTESGRFPAPLGNEKNFHHNRK